MRGALVALVVVAGCKYDPASINPGGGDDAQPPTDGDADSPTTCATAGETACKDTRTQVTCGNDGTIDPTLDKTCDFACLGGQCVTPSNIPPAVVVACNATAPRLVPQASALVTIGGTSITCGPNCGDGSVGSISPVAMITSGEPTLSIYCLRELDLSLGTILFAASPQAIAFVVDGDVVIGQNLTLDGGSASGGSQGGFAGSGGFAGGDRSGATGVVGGGPCGGTGGEHSDVAGDQAGGGGGGGGNLTTGGAGGDGLASLITLNALGGAGGNACSDATMIPLIGGSGGGGGGKGNCSNCGFAGGGGGGALQLASRTSITISSLLSARGGDGFGDFGGNGSEGGGGGGGAGGGFLLEAPSIAITGGFDVTGGNGGTTGAGAGGTGGNATPTDGTDAANANEGGAGGGGAAGRVRLNASNAQCTGVTPAAACKIGLPPAAPP